jgi:hypothetical protein
VAKSKSRRGRTRAITAAELMAKLYDRIAAIYRELRRRGPEAQNQLLSLLDHADPGVRGWVGAHALEFAPHLGEPALMALVCVQDSLVSFSAEMTLREWRAGRLEFP